MTPWTTTEETPFSMVYGLEAVLPEKISVELAWIAAYTSIDNEFSQVDELHLIEERRAQAFYRMEQYKSWVCRVYN